MSKATVRAIFILIMLSLSAGAQPQSITGKVVSVSDGDTLTLLDSNKQELKIHLIGIDAPENTQSFGDKAKNSLSDLVRGKTVTVINLKIVRNGWTVGKVTLSGRDINLEQIRRGFAWFYRAYAKELSQIDAAAYEQSEARARDERRGLWSELGPLAPWDLRAAQRGKSAETELEEAPIVGDRSSKIYYRTDCPDYLKVSEVNREMFMTESAAVAAGYKKATNCP